MKYAGEVPRVYACELWRDDKYAATEIGSNLLAANPNNYVIS